jgi:hypothetical protein
VVGTVDDHSCREHRGDCTIIGRERDRSHHSPRTCCTEGIVEISTQYRGSQAAAQDGADGVWRVGSDGSILWESIDDVADPAIDRPQNMQALEV